MPGRFAESTRTRRKDWVNCRISPTGILFAISSARVSIRTIRLVWLMVRESCQLYGYATFPGVENRSSMRIHSIPLASKHRSVILLNPLAKRKALIASHVGSHWYSFESCKTAWWWASPVVACLSALLDASETIASNPSSSPFDSIRLWAWFYGYNNELDMNGTSITGIELMNSLSSRTSAIAIVDVRFSARLWMAASTR